jgi:uncharacterized protein (TIGR02453 family)
MMSKGFGGFTPDALGFYEGLEDDNSKAYWTAQKATFDEHVKAAMAEFLASLPDQYQPFHVFRPNRDVRFSKDKSPYKTMHGATSETEGGSIRYTHLSSRGVLFAAGHYMPQNDQLARLREAIADDKRGAALEKLLVALAKKGYAIGPGGSEPLKTAPKGYSAEHPRIERLRWKGLIASTEVTDLAAVTSPAIRSAALRFWKATQPLLDWLDNNVGPSVLTFER